MLFNEREQKMIRLVLDPGAQEGEIANGATLLVRSLRARGITPDVLLGHSPADRPGAEKPNATGTLYIFPNWGKNANKSFAQIEKSYLSWVVRVWFVNLDEEGRRQWQWLDHDIRAYLKWQ
jgi:hypothetical protein